MTQKEERRKSFCNITVEVTKEFNALVSSAAKREDVSKSQLVRKAIREYLDK